MSSVTSGRDTRREGWLYKPGKIDQHNWKKRYFVLSGSFLYRFNKPASGSGMVAPAKGMIDLKDSQVFSRDTVKPFCFAIVDNTHKEHILVASDIGNDD